MPRELGLSCGLSSWEPFEQLAYSNFQHFRCFIKLNHLNHNIVLGSRA